MVKIKKDDYECGRQEIGDDNQSREQNHKATKSKLGKKTPYP